jgi:hypothetical protein
MVSKKLVAEFLANGGVNETPFGCFYFVLFATLLLFFFLRRQAY